MRKMKSRVLAVLMAAGMIFTAQGMTVLAGTTGIGAAKTASQTGGPGEVKQDIGTVTVDDTQETSGETGQNTGTQENAGGTVSRLDRIHFRSTTVYISEIRAGAIRQQITRHCQPHQSHGSHL